MFFADVEDACGRMDKGVDAGTRGDDRKFAGEGMCIGKGCGVEPDKQPIGFTVNPFTIAHWTRVRLDVEQLNCTMETDRIH